ncbi:capsule assembly Wzi family protein [Sphingobacterium rhinopitheci]|uniref:capsule assembly Wzi family protein n=1 Tax=Sphingobacterium rhinopitheci TaxID=2781960 RepID=UPI001F5212C8|nr:capsule assembly Wzi family protein [Sphingobacterium rhinopitheci]MCI0922481.1 hypothetical protein [Sphingobacterium rhinopitheci]
MKIIYTTIILWAITMLNLAAFAQGNDSLYRFDATLMGTYAGPKVVPFWMRANQYGSTPLEGASVSFLVRATKEYAFKNYNQALSRESSKWDWGYALEARANVGASANVQLIDAHIKAKYSIFEVKLGRTKDVMGLNGDTLLSSGNFAVSGNALGIPSLNLAVSDYYRIPMFDGLISLKGNLSYGYMGKMYINENKLVLPMEDNRLKTVYHQKSLYGRIGKESWRVNLFGGINHHAQYGSEKKIYGDVFELNTIESLWYVFFGKSYGGIGVPRSKLGNQQGSIDLGMTYDWDNIQVMGYRQNFYDVGAIAKLANIRDGLNGITITNKLFNKVPKKFDWHKLLVEFFYSKDQAGYPWSKRTKSGDEDYYNNFFYLQGWSYKDVGIGSPLIVTANTAKEGQAHYPNDYFISNRVVAGHIGFSGGVSTWLFQAKLTASKHYGTFATSEFGKSTGVIWAPPYKDQFVPVMQYSSYLQAERLLKKQLYIGFKVAADYGKMFNNSVAAQLSIRKSFAY